jgi:hypothetical protein
MAGCDPYVELEYWVLGYAEGELECVSGSKGFGGWSYTEEELAEFARADRRKRIIKQIRELERELDIARAWAQMEEHQRHEEITTEIADLERRKSGFKLN